MSYVIVGYHRNGYHFPGVRCTPGTWARNVSFGAIETELDKAEAAGWEGLRATKESF